MLSLLSHRTAVFRAVAFAVLVAPRSARAQAPSARSELEQGYVLRKQGNFVDALPHLLESYRLDPQLKTLINLADCEEHIGKLVEARRHWGLAHDQAAGEHVAEIEEESGRRVSALAKRIPTLTVLEAPDRVPALRIDEDGLPLPAESVGAPVPTDPGRHTLVVHAEGFEDWSVEVILKAGDSVDVSVMTGPKKTATPNAAGGVERATPSTPLRLVGPLAAGVGALGLGVGTYFGIVAIEKQNDANCPGNVCTAPAGHPDVLRDANNAGKLSTAFMVAGGVFVAGGVALWLLAPRGDGSRVALAPAVLRDGAGAALAGRW